MTLLLQIKEFQTQKNDSKKTIADYILQKGTDLASMTLDDIYQDAYVSKASLVRFAKSLGFSGWKTLMVPLMQELYQEESFKEHADPDLPFKSEDDVTTVIQKMASLQMDSIQDTLHTLDKNSLVQATYSIKKAKRVVMFGISPNHLFADLFRRRMLSIGKIIEVCPSHEEGLVSRTLTEEDLAIFISYSGKGINSGVALEQLQTNGVTILSLTGYHDSPLREKADIVLTISSREQVINKLSSFASEESIIFLLNCLYATYFSTDYASHFSYKKDTEQSLEQGRR